MRHAAAVRSAVFSPDGRLVLTASMDSTARLWETATGKAVGEPMRRHTAYVNSALFSPDGKLVLTASWDNTARLWETATGKPAGEPILHTADVYSAVFSPDGRLVLTASKDSPARLWETATGKAVGEPMLHTADVYRVVFSPDGRLVLTVSSDKTAQLWPLLPQPLEGRPEQLVAGSEGLTLRRIAPDGGPEWLYPGDAPVESQLAEPLRWFAEPVRTRAIWPGAALSVPQYILREIQDARRFSADGARARQILNEAYIVDPTYPLIHLALAMLEEDKETAGFLRDNDLKRLPESCNYTQDLDPREALKLAAQMCSEQGDEERARMAMEKLKALDER